MDKVYFSLRENREATETIDGEDWGVVYLDNARLATISAHAFAGYLSALADVDLYMPSGDPAFGLVKL